MSGFSEPTNVLNQDSNLPQFRINIVEDPLDVKKTPPKRKLKIAQKKIISEESLERVFQPKFFLIRSFAEFLQIQYFVLNNFHKIDEKNILNVLSHYLNYLKLETFIRQKVIDDVRPILKKLKELKLNTKENYLEFLLDLRLPKSVSKQFAILILEILSEFYQIHNVSPDENIKLFHNFSPVYFLFADYINPLSIQERGEYDNLTQQQERQLNDLLEIQIENLVQVYEQISDITKFRVCTIIKKLKIQNHNFVERLCFDLQKNWMSFKFDNLILFLQVLVRYGNVFPFKLLYQVKILNIKSHKIRDHLNDQPLTSFSIRDSLTILEIMVKSRIRFNDFLVENLFYNIYNKINSSYMSTGDKIMSLFYYTKFNYFRDLLIQNFLIEQVAADIQKLNDIQIKIFLLSLSDLQINDDKFMLKLKKQFELHGHIGRLEEFQKLSIQEKKYNEYILKVISQQ